MLNTYIVPFEFFEPRGFPFNGVIMRRQVTVAEKMGLGGVHEISLQLVTRIQRYYARVTLKSRNWEQSAGHRFNTVPGG